MHAVLIRYRIALDLTIRVSASLVSLILTILCVKFTIRTFLQVPDNAFPLPKFLHILNNEHNVICATSASSCDILWSVWRSLSPEFLHILNDVPTVICVTFPVHNLLQVLYNAHTVMCLTFPFSKFLHTLNYVQTVICVCHSLSVSSCTP